MKGTFKLSEITKKSFGDTFNNNKNINFPLFDGGRRQCNNFESFDRYREETLKKHGDLLFEIDNEDPELAWFDVVKTIDKPQSVIESEANYERGMRNWIATGGSLD
jgi:hypothetical protein